MLWKGHWAALLLFSCSNWWFQLNRKGQHWQSGHKLIHSWGCTARPKGFMSSFQGQESGLRLHLSVSGQSGRPGRDCWSSASSNRDKDHSHWQWAEGRKEGSQLQVGAEERVIITVCWVRGREEGVRHSKRWNITKFLRRSFCTGRLGTLLWITKTNRWLEGNLKHTKAKKQQQSCDNNPGFLNPNLVPYPRDCAALQISLRHFLSCLCSQCLTIPTVSVFQTWSFGNGPSLNLST